MARLDSYFNLRKQIKGHREFCYAYLRVGGKIRDHRRIDYSYLRIGKIISWLSKFPYY